MFSSKYAIFKDGGYNVEGLTYWLEDGSKHTKLLDYAEKDLSPLPGLLHELFSKKLDMETLDLNDGYEFTTGDLLALRKLIESLHRFYEGNLDVIQWTMADYLGYLYTKAEVAVRLHKKSLTAGDSANTWLDEVDKWFRVRLDALFDFPYPADLNVYETFDGIEEKISFEVDKNLYARFRLKSDRNAKPELYLREIGLQETVRRILFWTMDVDAPGLNRLTAALRAKIYSHRFEDTAIQDSANVKKFLSIGAFSEKDDFGDCLNSVHLNTAHCYPGPMSNEAEEALRKVAEAAKGASAEGYSDVYEIEDLRQLLYLELQQMINADILIKRCRNCKKYFVAPGTGVKVEYCDRVAPGETKKTCKDVGAARTEKNKKAANKLYAIFRSEYHTRFGRARRRVRLDGSKAKDDPKLQAWEKKARKMYDEEIEKENPMTEDEFRELLKGL